MIKRPFWIRAIRSAWKKRPIAWLSGVRRVGKTTLARMLPDAHYLNCELPSVCRRLADPESFLEQLPERAHLILDEVHRLEDPSRILKIAADEYPHLRVLATGSSTLAATRKFRDTLTGRKVSIYLPPVLWDECLGAFGIRELDRRLLHGGLPEPLLASQKDPSFFAEWQDSFYARDIQELFAIRHRTGFLRLLSLLLRQSGGQVDYTHLADLSELSRPTVMAHIEAMTIAHAMHLIAPFHGGGRREITRRPKCYAFDTGFICFTKGWNELREEDRGPLWEHLVLDYLRSRLDVPRIFYWRDKAHRELDFVFRFSRDRVRAIECKLNPDRFDPGALLAFRALYPRGDNFVVSPFIRTPYRGRLGGIPVTFCSLTEALAKYRGPEPAKGK